ncbi:glycine cleavage system protein R [Singulisphaera sp. PoT]|uniref:glycine cleavage system protein R n=1 Tax=Singulisphaera sp. PoT TaxID=3411797 RepID=UPI003BF4898F
MHKYIVTVTAADRVGIVFSVAGTLRDQKGNILELSQTVMGGYFTIILAVDFQEPRDAAELAKTITERGKRFELTVAVLEAKDSEIETPVPDGERFILTVLGEDSPGQVHGIAGCLAAHGVNIVDLHSRGDGSKFAMVMEAFLPPELGPSTIRAELERYGRDHGLDAYVQHENIFLATSEPSPVRVGPALRPQGDAVVPH